jgi:hypothetical protein
LKRVGTPIVRILCVSSNGLSRSRLQCYRFTRTGDGPDSANGLPTKYFKKKSLELINIY